MTVFDETLEFTLNVIFRIIGVEVDDRVVGGRTGDHRTEVDARLIQRGRTG